MNILNQKSFNISLLLISSVLSCASIYAFDAEDTAILDRADRDFISTIRFKKAHGILDKPAEHVSFSSLGLKYTSDDNRTYRKEAETLHFDALQALLKDEIRYNTRRAGTTAKLDLSEYTRCVSAVALKASRDAVIKGIDKCRSTLAEDLKLVSLGYYRDPS